MHHHHSRALRIARRNYNFCKGVVARRITDEQSWRAMCVARLHCSESIQRSYQNNYKEAVRRLELALVELQNQLSVVVTVERLLEKA